MPSFVNIAADSDIIDLFCRTAPIVKQEAQFVRAMQTTEGRYDMALALMYYALGYRACRARPEPR